MKHIHLFLSFVLIFSINLLNASIPAGPSFGNTGAITICVNGSYYLNPSTTNGTFSTLSATIATVNASGYVTGVSVGTTTVSLAATGGGTVTATVTVVSGLSITDPLAQPSYKFNNNPQGPIGGLNNYVGYNGYNYSNQARPSNTGFFRASNQLGDAAGCPYEYYIFRCTTCGTVPEYAIRPQGTFTGNSIQPGSNGQLTYTSSNGGGPFAIVYLPSGGANVTFNSVSNPVVIPLGAFTNSKSYNLISVTDESTKASTDFSGTIATVSVVPPSASLTGSQSICTGTIALLNLTSTGTGSITVTLNNGTIINTVSGTTTISVTPTINTTYTIASVTDSYGNSGTATSSATVSIYAPASITVQPVSTVTIYEGTATTLSVTATGEPTISYQWYKNSVAISGAISSSYITTNTMSATGTYYVTVSTTCNVVSSTTSTVTVKSYSVTIGTQVWTNNNLDITAYRNGDIIPQVTDPTAWAGLTTGAWCYFNNDHSNNAIYGKLYNWHAVNDPRGLAPAGWHIPTYEEWTTLGSSLGGNSIAGGKMKATGTNTLGTGLWDSPNSDATNISGFSGLPGGFRYADGTFNYVGQLGYWWSFTQPSPDIYGGGFYRRLQSNDPTVESLDNPKKSGMSVRLIKGDHYVGESFGGGIVAYILEPGDNGYDANVQHGLIASTSDISAGIQWYNLSYTSTGATATAIGTGSTNTTAIINSQVNTNTYAAKLARDYSIGIYLNWYLPSKDELYKLYLNRVAIGGFTNNTYWSSTELSQYNTWYQDFSNGNQSNLSKNGTKYVRAIRSF